MPTQTSFEEAVRAGVALLDRNGPANWRDRINVDQLETSSTYACVIGQVFAGDYRYGYDESPWDLGLQSLGLRSLMDGRTEDDIVRYGFEAPNEPFGRSYDSLTAAWRRYLTTGTTQAQDQTEETS